MNYELLRVAKAFLVSSRYLPRYSKNVNLPFLLRILTLIRSQKSIPIFNKKFSSDKISNNYVLQIRKRKILIDDIKNKIVVHVFFSNHEKKRYAILRNLFTKQIKSDYFSFPQYKLIPNYFNLLVVVEEKILGSSLENVNQKILCKFLDIFFHQTKKQLYNFQKIKLGTSLYLQLKVATEKIKDNLKSDSSFFNLYTLCGNPFDNPKGNWPSVASHGQALPVNIIYNEEKNKFFYIDYEPNGMCQAPYAYDYCFFVLFSIKLISSDYKLKLKKILSNFSNKHEISRAFLAQIIWWSKDKDLNENQINKINERSKIALSLFEYNHQNA